MESGFSLALLSIYLLGNSIRRNEVAINYKKSPASGFWQMVRQRRNNSRLNKLIVRYWRKKMITYTLNCIEVERIVRETIIELLMLSDIKAEDIPLNNPKFWRDLGATSIDTLELFLSIEKKFDFQFSESELSPNMLNTLKDFVNSICNKLEITAEA
jgi:acyl carrier protein